MKTAVFSIHHFERTFFNRLTAHFSHDLTYFEANLNLQTAPLAAGFDCVCCFVQDTLDEPTLKFLKEAGIRLIALRSAGYNNVDLEAADLYEIKVMRVPAYSPHAVAEYAVGLLLSLNRKIHKAYARVRDQNFSLEGLVGFDLFGKTIGVIGTGRIGTVFSTIMNGFGCKVIAYDPVPNLDLLKQNKVSYLPLNEIYQRSDLISLHVPLLPGTRHMIDKVALEQMKPGALIINTGRGALIDSCALIDALKSGHVGGAALDVYEEEEGIFFRNLSDQILKDDILARLMSFPNVLMTSHQAFLTSEALLKITETTLQNISDFEAGRDSENEVRAATHIANHPENQAGAIAPANKKSKEETRHESK
jgi:D-lactate dehydrogenase